MPAKVFKDVQDIASQYTGLSRKVLEYSVLVTGLVDTARTRPLTQSDWAPLEALVETASFERVGNFKEVWNWSEYRAFLSRWISGGVKFEASFKRITEHDGVVLLELEERASQGEHRSVVNSLSVYEFNAAQKLQHLDIYLQMEPIPPGRLKAYKEQQISGDAP